MASDAILNQNSPHLLTAIVRSVCGLISSADAFLYLRSPEKDVMEMVIGEGFYSNQVGYKVKPGDGLAGKVWKEGRPIVVNDYNNWSGKHPDPLWEGLKAIAAVPIKSGDDICGVLGVHHCKDGECIRHDQMEMIQHFASLVSTALDNAALLQQTKKELEQKESKEKDLLCFKQLFEASPNPQLLIKDNHFIDCNQATVTLLGYQSKEELLNTHPSELSPLTQPDGTSSNQKADRMISLATNGGSHRFEWIHKKANGELFPVEVTLTDISDKSGQLIHTLWRDISAWKMAEEKINATNRRLNDIIDFLPDATFVINRQGEVLAWNRAIEELTGVKAEKILGKGDYEYSIPFWGDRRPVMIDLVIDWNEEKAQHYEFVRQQGETLVSESHIPGLKPGGAYLFNTARALYNDRGDIVGAIESIRDVTEHRRAEFALAESENRLSEVIDFFPDPAFVIDNSSKVQFWNRAMVELTGIKAEAIVGKGNFEYALPFYGERRPILIDMALNWDDDYLKKYISINRRDDGVLMSQSFHSDLNDGIYLSGTARVLYDASGKATGAIESLRNITDQKKAEEELERLITQLQIKTEEMERFVYTASHDLKSPLVTISGFSGMAKEDLASNDQESCKKSLDMISQAANRMQQLLNELLNISRVGFKIDPSVTVNLGAIIREAMDNVSGVISKNNTTIEIETDLPDVTVDTHYLLQVVENLLANASRYSKDANEGSHITFGVIKEAHELICYVKDNGIGIEPRFLNKVFDLFERLDPDSDGTGVGLTIVKRIIEAHGGRIWAESEGLGYGTTFFFTLPEAKQ